MKTADRKSWPANLCEKFLPHIEKQNVCHSRLFNNDEDDPNLDIFIKYAQKIYG